MQDSKIFPEVRVCSIMIRTNSTLRRFEDVIRQQHAGGYGTIVGPREGYGVFRGQGRNGVGSSGSSGCGRFIVIICLGGSKEIKDEEGGRGR